MSWIFLDNIQADVLAGEFEDRKRQLIEHFRTRTTPDRPRKRQLIEHFRTRTTAKAFAKNVFLDQERKLEVRRRSDTALVLTINNACQRSAGVPPMTRRAASGKPELLGSGGSMVAKLKLKGIDGRAPPGVEPAA